VPLAVLTKGKSQLPVVNGTSLESEWIEMQSELKELSMNSWQSIMENSGHNMYKDAPDAIITNIIKVVELARKNINYIHIALKLSVNCF